MSELKELELSFRGLSDEEEEDGDVKDGGMEPEELDGEEEEEIV